MTTPEIVPRLLLCPILRPAVSLLQGGTGDSVMVRGALRAPAEERKPDKLSGPSNFLRLVDPVMSPLRVRSPGRNRQWG